LSLELLKMVIDNAGPFWRTNEKYDPIPVVVSSFVDFNYLSKFYRTTTIWHLVPYNHNFLIGTQCQTSCSSVRKLYFCSTKCQNSCSSVILIKILEFCGCLVKQ